MSGAFITNSLDTLPQTYIGGPISSQYILYANGFGQSFWGPTVSQSTIDSLSTLNTSQFQQLSTSIQQTNSNLSALSTFTISSVNGAIVSSAQSLETSFGILSNSFNIFSNTTQAEFQGLSNTLTTQVNNIYNSSIAIVESTLQAISSISTFTNDIAAARALTSAAASSLSTAIAVTNASTTSALTTQFNSSLRGVAISTTSYTNSQISSLSTVLATQSSLSVFSTQINEALISTSANLYSITANNISSLYLQLIGFEQSTFSTQSWAISTLNEYDQRLDLLEAMSSQISSVTASQISSYISPLFSTQDAQLSLYTSSVLNQISSLRFSTLQNTLQISTISSFSFFTTSSLQGQITTTSNALSTLTYEFNVLTTSSILAGVYDTFLALEDYTVALINSTIDSVNPFKSGLVYSTTLQNTSTANGFFNAFVSSTYLSTVSTLVPITTAYVSSLVSTLYSTGTYYLISSFDSTIFGKTDEFTSTTTSYTNQIVLSSQYQLNSSILSYLSAPTGLALNTFSTQGAAAISTFNGLGASTLGSQSSIFGSTNTANQALTSTMLGRGNSTILALSQTQSTYTSLFPSLYSSFQVSSIVQLSTQNTQFISSLGSYGATIQFVIGSTNSAVLSQTTAAANSALSTLVISTNNTYTAFVNSLLAQNSSIALSSLYTVQNITLTSTNFEGQMDMGAFTNFAIQVQGPLVSGSSNYRVTHAANIGSLGYRRGIITVDVSTIGSGYSNNGGALCLDVYRWGLPTTVWGSVYPSLSNADYMAMYEYTIQNSIVYTNLLNVYPRLRLTALQFQNSQVYNVLSGANVVQSNYFWRGTPMRLQWSNYSHFPMGMVGAPPYSPEIMVDVIANNQIQARNGPYTMATSTLTFNLPYYSGSCNNPVTTTIRTYIAGKQSEAQELTVQVLVPKFQEVRFTPLTGRFVSLQEIEAWSDSGSNVFLNTSQIGLFGTAVGSNLALGGSNVTFGRSNAVDGNATSICLGPTSVGVPDTNAYLQLLPNLTTTTTAISTLMVYNVPSASNQARGTGDGTTEMESTLLRANVTIGATQFYSTFRLTSSMMQTFSF
jgi:hypothetical protein